IPGIYSVVNNVNGKCYIGSSYNLRRRRTDHLRALRDGKHPNKILQAAYKKYGEENFSFEFIEHVPDTSLLIKREQAWVDFMNPEYNICRQMVNSRLGVKLTKEQCDAIKAKGRKASPETRKKLSDSHKGYVIPKEQREKIA